MEIEILQKPDSAIAQIEFGPNEELVAEAGAMIAMSPTITVNTTLRKGQGGGILGGLKRLVAQESLFLSVFQACHRQEKIFLAPRLMGDMILYEMKGNELIVQAGSYVASGTQVNIDLGFQGFKSVFSGESIFWLTISGYGPVLLSAFGGIYEIDVRDSYIVDTGHIVAFEKSLSFEITKPGSSWLGAFLGGEGFVCRFQGKGKLYCQTHKSHAFGSLIGSKLPPK